MVFLALTFYASISNINYLNKTSSESQLTWMKVIQILRRKKNISSHLKNIRLDANLFSLFCWVPLDIYLLKDLL